MNREYKDYITDILTAIDKIDNFTKGFNYSKFKKDDKTIFSVIRALEIIGEAVKKIPANIKNNYKQVPWKEMAGMRDKLIHEYFGVDTKVVWKTIKEDISQVKPFIKKLNKDLS